MCILRLTAGVYRYFPVDKDLKVPPYGGAAMAKVRTTVYIDTETNAALRDYARRHRISIGEANNLLLRRALFGGLDEGMEAMLVPEIRKAVGEAARREIQENMSRLLGGTDGPAVRRARHQWSRCVRCPEARARRARREHRERAVGE